MMRELFSDRRAVVFVVFALVCVALVPLADPEHRWVAWTTAAAYVVLAVLSAIDHWSRSRS
jgi:uncharacterized membrane protein YqjE